MQDSVYLIITSIAGPTDVLKQWSAGCSEHGWKFVMIGDERSPVDFELAGCDYYGLDRQKKLDLKFAELCPTRHYARKNIGYLLAMAGGASVIVETDDDNIPADSFWRPREKSMTAGAIENGGWVNAYRYFSDANIWPRGFPLQKIAEQAPAYESLEQNQLDCPIQQNLADDNPDVDAVYRLALPLPQQFRKDRRVAFGQGSWCPFNSQNTTWFKEAFKLMYLPAYCSFRMTDIWRSFVAQAMSRRAGINDWHVLFAEPTVRQERNVHNLLKDFADEIPGYFNNERIVEALQELPLKPGQDSIDDNLKRCYEKLIDMSLVGADELPLLQAWLGDISQLNI